MSGPLALATRSAHDIVGPTQFAAANLVLASAVQMALIDVLDAINACGHG